MLKKHLSSKRSKTQGLKGSSKSKAQSKKAFKLGILNFELVLSFASLYL